MGQNCPITLTQEHAESNHETPIHCPCTDRRHAAVGPVPRRRHQGRGVATRGQRGQSAPGGREQDCKRGHDQAPASSKLVDINTATSKELKKLPGIDDAKAAKIIAGRLYGSKAQLVSRNIIDAAEYENLKKLIVAKQPYKDAASNAALYTDKK